MRDNELEFVRCSTSPSSQLGLPFSRSRLATPSCVTGCEDSAMTLDYVLGALVTAGLLFYLTFALVRPERF